MGFAPGLRWMTLMCGLGVCVGAHAQGAVPEPEVPAAGPASATPQVQVDPNSAEAKRALKSRPGSSNAESASARSSVDEAEALRVSKLAIVNGRPYDQPSAHDQFVDYLNDSYGLAAQGRTAVRAAYSQAQDAPKAWDQDFTGYMQRYGVALVTTALVGNIRYGMENVFHEDLRYIPCHGCGFKKKVENALLAEITARHSEDGHRFFTLTPTVADFMGPIIAHSLPLYPGGANPAAGAVSARLVFATRIGAHLFTEFVWERRKKEKEIDQ